MKPQAIIYTHGLLDDVHGKTAHGLIRYSRKYDIMAVVDFRHAGKDAGLVIGAEKANIPVYESVASYLKEHGKPEYFIIGVAFAGGRLPSGFEEVINPVLQDGISIVSGLHQFLSANPEYSQLAADSGAEIIDIRRPKNFDQLNFWKGEIAAVTTPKVAVLGIDCAVGKRTTARMLTNLMEEKGVRSEMIYTGQTGFLQGNPYGFILDATPNDFVSGELEDAILRCVHSESPEIIFLEGQSGLRNPSGPCGSEFLLSAASPKVVLQYTPFRKCYEGLGEKFPLPSLSSEINLIESYGTEVIAVTLNGEGRSLEDLKNWQSENQGSYSVPLCAPLIDGVEPLWEIFATMVHDRGRQQQKTS